HYFYEEMQAMTDIPIINMIDETCRYIAENKTSKKIVVLGTSGTIETGVYPKYAKKHGLESVVLDKEFMDISMETIYNVKNHMILDSEKFNEILNFYKDNDVKVILACTELSCLNIPENLRENTVDAMDILIKKSIEYSNKDYKKKKVYALLFYVIFNNMKCIYIFYYIIVLFCIIYYRYILFFYFLFSLTLCLFYFINIIYLLCHYV